MKEPKKINFMALMAKEDIAESEFESSQGSKSESESNDEYLSNPNNQKDEIPSLLVEKLYTIITCLIRKLVKSKDQIGSLLKEVKDLKEETSSSSLAKQVQEETSTLVEKLKDEYSFLKGQVKELRSFFGKVHFILQVFKYDTWVSMSLVQSSISPKILSGY